MAHSDVRQKWYGNLAQLACVTDGPFPACVTRHGFLGLSHGEPHPDTAFPRNSEGRA